MKNKLSDLNDHLFAQMERLGEENISQEKLDKEINRTKAITSVAREIVSNARLVLDAQVKLTDPVAVPGKKEVPKLLT